MESVKDLKLSDIFLTEIFFSNISLLENCLILWESWSEFFFEMFDQHLFGTYQGFTRYGPWTSWVWIYYTYPWKHVQIIFFLKIMIPTRKKTFSALKFSNLENFRVHKTIWRSVTWNNCSFYGLNNLMRGTNSDGQDETWYVVDAYTLGCIFYTYCIDPLLCSFWFFYKVEISITFFWGNLVGLIIID